MPARLGVGLTLLLSGGLLSGCGGPAPEAMGPQEPAAPEAVVALSTVEHLGGLAREPMLVQHPGGTLFVAGYGSQVTGTDPNSPPQLWRSDDGGATWGAVPVGTAADGAAGNSDVDLAIGPDGTLYFSAMGFDRATRRGTHIALGASLDLGASWTWTTVSRTPLSDRPWVAVAPDGTAHAIWNDGAGVSHRLSTDRGTSWEERPKISERGGSSHLAVGPDGELAVRITPLAASGNAFDDGLDEIAVSTDGGATWTHHAIPGEITWDPTFSDPAKIPRWVEPLAWDAGGALYHLWSEGSALKLARSRDRGATWTIWDLSDSGGDDSEPRYFPYVIARGVAELAATWFSGVGDAMAAHVAWIEAPDDDAGTLLVLETPPFQPDTWRESDGVRDPAGEYVPVAFVDERRLAVVTPVQDSEHDRWGFAFRLFELR